MERVAVVGSRKGADLHAVRSFLDRLHRKSPDTVVVSGGAAGVDTAAEQHWLGLGGRVISFRPYASTPECFWVQELGLVPPFRTEKPYARFHREPSWATYNGALFWRNKLIAAKCNRMVWFMAEPPTAGTMLARDCADAEGKPRYDGSAVVKSFASV